MAKQKPIRMPDLKKLRKEKGISQKRLSKISGVSRFRIQEFEAGYIQPLENEKIILTVAILEYKDA